MSWGAGCLELRMRSSFSLTPCKEHCACSLPKRYTKLGLNPVFALAGVYQKLHETTHERTNEVWNMKCMLCIVNMKYKTQTNTRMSLGASPHVLGVVLPLLSHTGTISQYDWVVSDDRTDLINWRVLFSVDQSQTFNEIAIWSLHMKQFPLSEQNYRVYWTCAQYSVIQTELEW